MTDAVRQPALLSKAQLDVFRREITRKHEALFLAPQLLEQVTILTRHLKVTLGQLEAARAVVADLDRASANRASSGERCLTCRDEPIAAAIRQLRVLLDHE